jgi:4'-phosphopantetheinyl transferase
MKTSKINSELRLTEHDVHVWSAWLDQPTAIVTELRASLSNDEVERAERFASERLKRRFITARGVLRKLLGRYTEMAPDEIIFVYGGRGKPSLAPWLGVPVTFNLSHSGGLALFAFACNREVGIDVEEMAPIEEADLIADRCFSKEEARRVRFENRQKEEIFYSYWTRREALVKCTGDGITDEMCEPGQPFKGFICEMSPAEGYKAALAAKGPAFEVTAFHWPHNEDRLAKQPTGMVATFG